MAIKGKYVPLIFLLVGYFYESLVTTLRFDNNKQLVGESKSFVFEGNSVFFCWQHENQSNYDGQSEWSQIAEGLWVNIRNKKEIKEVLENAPRFNVEGSKDDNQFKFQQNYTPPKKNRSIFYYLVVPQYCYVDEDVIKEIVRKESRLATIYTREKNQCIGIVYDKDFLVELSFTLDEWEFNNIRNQTQPKRFTSKYRYIDPAIEPIFQVH